MSWLNPLDPKVRAAVVSGFYGKTPHSSHHAPVPTDPDEIDVIADVLAQASEMLSSLTAETIHPAMQVVEDYIVFPGTTRLTPTYLPLRQVVSLYTVSESGIQQSRLVGGVVHGDSIRFVEPTYDLEDFTALDFASMYFQELNCACPGRQRLRVTYNAGSTLTASARAAVIALAHELYLRVSPCDECGVCRLPMRTTSVTREGISYNIGDPLDATGLAVGGTGLPDVDLWLRGVNPRQATMRSAVYTAIAPPPVVHSIVAARPTFPPLQQTILVARARVIADGRVA